MPLIDPSADRIKGTPGRSRGFHQPVKGFAVGKARYLGTFEEDGMALGNGVTDHMTDHLTRQTRTIMHRVREPRTRVRGEAEAVVYP